MGGLQWILETVWSITSITERGYLQKNQQEQVPMGAVMVMATAEKMENQNNETKSTKNTKTILPFDQIPKTCKDAFDAHEDMHGDHHFKECQFKSSLFYHKKANKRKNEQGEPS